MAAVSMPDQVSVNQVNGAEYAIPRDGDDRQAIDAFIAKNGENPVVVVQGLGFVGGVMSLVCANALHAEYSVIGIDLPTPESYWKIRSINDGVLPLKSSDPKVEEYFQRAMEKGNLYASFDDYAYSLAGVVIVDINLDVQKSSSGDAELTGFDVDLQPFSNAIRAIGRNCKPDVLVLVETTVPPGTCEKVVAPLLREELELRGLPTNAFRLGHSYERVMPGPDYIDSIQNFYRVYAGIDSESADATERFLKTIIRTDEYPLTRLQRTNATEMAKVLENSFRAMNIAFMVEWSRFAEEAEVNLYEIVRAIRMRDTHRNIMLPGIGVGGYCLTKDPLLASWSRQKLFGAETGLPQSEQGVRINDKMPRYAFELLRRKLGSSALPGIRVLLLGVSYRGDVGDTRFSPVEPFCRLLREAGCDVMAHDYFVDYWSECEMTVETDLAMALAADCDVIAYTAGHSEYRQNALIANRLARPGGRVVFDTIGLLTESEIENFSLTNNRVIVLGRGSIDNKEPWQGAGTLRKESGK